MSYSEHMVSPQAIEFSPEALQTLRSPGVYMYVREDKAIYVGASSSAIGRALARNHHRRKDLLVGTSLLLFPCKSAAEARQLEDKFIADLQPELNQRGGIKQLAQKLSVSLTTAERRAKDFAVLQTADGQS